MVAGKKYIIITRLQFYMLWNFPSTREYLASQNTACFVA
jgi:hypothetical protein